MMFGAVEFVEVDYTHVAAYDVLMLPMPSIESNPRLSFASSCFPCNSAVSVSFQWHYVI